MLKKTRIAAGVHTRGVQGQVYVVIAFDIIGAIVNYQVVCFHLMLKEHMIGLLKISSEYGIRS